MKNKTTYYTISALLWLLVGLVCYLLHSFQNKETKTEQNLIASANEIHQLHNLGFDEYEIWIKREKRDEIMREYTNPRGRVLLDTISSVEKIVDSLEMQETISFAHIESLYYRDYHDHKYVDDLKSMSENESFYNQSNLDKLLYKNVLLTTLRGKNNARYHNIGCFCSFFSTPNLRVVEQNKIGLSLDQGFYDIFYCNYPKTKSNSFEFETVVEKLGRNPQIIRTRYKTTPKEGQELGIYDYEVIETIVEE